MACFLRGGTENGTTQSYRKRTRVARSKYPGVFRVAVDSTKSSTALSVSCQRLTFYTPGFAACTSRNTRTGGRLRFHSKFSARRVRFPRFLSPAKDALSPPEISSPVGLWSRWTTLVDVKIVVLAGWERIISEFLAPRHSQSGSSIIQ